MLLRSSLFLEPLIHFLLPYFLPSIPDRAAARAEIIEALASYGARTRAEMIKAVEIIAFSFTGLDVLAEAQATPDMSHAMRLRYRGCATGLNRATQATEAALARRQAADPPPAAEQAPEPTEDMAEAEVHQAIQHVRAKIDRYRARLSATHPAGDFNAQHDLNTAAWTGALMDVARHRDTSAHPPPTG